MLLRDAGLDSFLKRQKDHAVGLLVHGSNATARSAVVDRVRHSFAPDTEVRVLDYGSVRSDPGVLDNAFRAMSFFGGRELIVVEGCEDGFAKLGGSILAATTPGNFILLLAGALGKASALRTAAEAASLFYSLPVYDPSPADVMLRVVALLRESTLSFDDEAADTFSGLCAGDMGLALSEAEKLTLYCRGQNTVSRADVLASCSADGQGDIDAVIDAALFGDFAGVEKFYQELSEADTKAVAPLFAVHLVKLQDLRAAADQSGSVEGALRSARPPVFFSRKNAIADQLRIHGLDSLLQIHSQLEAATEQARQLPGLADQIMERMLFSAAQRSRSLSR